MTVLNWQLNPQFVAIYSDSLALDAADRRPRSMTTKVYVAAHLDACIAGTGIPLSLPFYQRVVGSYVVADVVHLDEFASELLSELYEEYKHTGLTSTVYTFGWSAKESRYVGFAYRSTHNFQSEPLGYGVAVKPAPNDPSLLGELYDQNALIELIKIQAEEDRARPRMERVGIGGDITLWLMNRDPAGKQSILVQHVERFASFEDDWKIALAKLPQNEGTLFSALALND